MNKYSTLSVSTAAFKETVKMKLKNHHGLLAFTQAVDWQEKPRRLQLMGLHHWLYNQMDNINNEGYPEYNFEDLEIACLEILLMDGDLDDLIYMGH